MMGQEGMLGNGSLLESSFFPFMVDQPTPGRAPWLHCVSSRSPEQGNKVCVQLHERKWPLHSSHGNVLKCGRKKQLTNTKENTPVLLSLGGTLAQHFLCVIFNPLIKAQPANQFPPLACNSMI